jgi:hypothetical protein
MLGQCSKVARGSGWLGSAQFAANRRTTGGTVGERSIAAAVAARPATSDFAPALRQFLGTGHARGVSEILASAPAFVAA